MNLEKGDLLIIQTNGVFAHLIKWSQWIRWRSGDEWKFNHAAVYIGSNLIVEANPAGVQISPLLEYSPNQYEVVKIQGDRNAAVKEALSLVHTPYGWLDIFAFLLMIMGVNPKFVDKINRRVSTLVCSQVAALAAQAAGDKRFSDPYLTVPAQIALQLV